MRASSIAEDDDDGDADDTQLTPTISDRGNVTLNPQTRAERMGEPPPSSYGASFGGFAPAPLTGTGSPSVGGSGMWPGGGGRGAIAGSESWVDRQTLTPEQRAAMERGDVIVGNVLFAQGAGYLLGRGAAWLFDKLGSVGAGLLTRGAANLLARSETRVGISLRITSAGRRNSWRLVLQEMHD